MKTEPNPFEKLLAPLAFLLVFFLLSRAPVDTDLWWHLRAGQVMWEQGRILLTDLFSYTKFGADWVNAFWLSEILLYWVHRLGGYFGIGFFTAFIGAAGFLIVFLRMKGNRLFNSFILVLAAMTAAPIWGPRPQILSFLFIAILDSWLSRSPRNKWILVPIFALWANIHGGWIWGFLLLAAHIAGTFANSFFASRRGGLSGSVNSSNLTGRVALADYDQTQLRKDALALLGWTVLAAFAVGLNPNGIAIWKLPFEQVNVSLQIEEWLSPDFHRLDFHPMLWMLFLLILAAPFARKPLDAGQLFKTLGFAYLTFFSQRNIALFAIVSAPLLADWLDSALESFSNRQARPTPRPSLNPRLAASVNALILILLAAVSLGNLFLITQPAKVDSNYPAAAVTWMKTNRPEGRLFNSYNWGGYILWTLPEYPVFIDGRADLYGNDLLNQWGSVVNAEDNAVAILDEWQVDIVFVEPHWGLVKILQAGGWRAAYVDRQSIILLRPTR